MHRDWEKGSRPHPGARRDRRAGCRTFATCLSCRRVRFDPITRNRSVRVIDPYDPASIITSLLLNGKKRPIKMSPPP